MNVFGMTSAAIALLLVSTASVPTAARTADALRPSDAHAACTATVDDPDPLDCPFCGGNPSVHLRAMWGIEKAVVRAHNAILI